MPKWVTNWPFSVMLKSRPFSSYEKLNRLDPSKNEFWVQVAIFCPSKSRWPELISKVDLRFLSVILFKAPAELYSKVSKVESAKRLLVSKWRPSWLKREFVNHVDRSKTLSIGERVILVRKKTRQVASIFDLEFPRAFGVLKNSQIWFFKGSSVVKNGQRMDKNYVHMVYECP